MKQSSLTLLLYALGGVFVALAGIFTIQHLKLEAGYSLALGVAALTSGAWRRRGALRTWVLGGLVSLTAWVLGAFYLNPSSFAFLFAVISAAAAGLLLVFDEAWREPETKGRRTERSMLTLITGGAILGAVWASYTFFLSPLGDGYLVRRLALTVTVLVLGVLSLAIGAKRDNIYWLATGGGYICVAAGKALFYDTVNTDGLLRIATFAASGLVLIGGAALVKKLQPVKSVEVQQ